MDNWVYVVISLLFLLIIVIIFYYEFKIHAFSKKLGMTLDNIILGKKEYLSINNDTLDDKINHKLKRIEEITEFKTLEALKEKDELKSLLGDISHQIKTPISNIKMYNNILLEREVSKEKQTEFLKLSNQQIDKLDFLINAMIKMSRLETGVIQLQASNNLVMPTFANALSQIVNKAELKNISVKVQCDDDISAFFDPKWTEEAIFNILDNAVKYTDKNGEVIVTVEVLDCYVAIHVSDNGIGISEEEQAMIFQRFYRSASVHNNEGVGIGLALAREIISKNQGFIKVSSSLNEGSKFSIYLLKENLSKL